MKTKRAVIVFFWLHVAAVAALYGVDAHAADVDSATDKLLEDGGPYAAIMIIEGFIVAALFWWAHSERKDLTKQITDAQKAANEAQREAAEDVRKAAERHAAEAKAATERHAAELKASHDQSITWAMQTTKALADYTAAQLANATVLARNNELHEQMLRSMERDAADRERFVERWEGSAPHRAGAKPR